MFGVGLSFPKFHFLEPQLFAEVGQLGAGAFVGILQNAAAPGGAADVVDGILSGVLLEIFIEGAEEARVAFNDLCQFIVEVGVRDLGLGGLREGALQSSYGHRGTDFAR